MQILEVLVYNGVVAIPVADEERHEHCQDLLFCLTLLEELRDRSLRIDHSKVDIRQRDVDMLRGLAL